MSRIVADRYSRRLEQAEGYLMLGLPVRALELLRAREDWGGLRFQAFFLEGEALRSLDRCREALECFERAAALRPQDPDIALALGWCYKRTHRLAQAIDALEHIKITNPNHVLAHYNLACYWSLAGNIERSISELAVALRLDPEMVGLISGEADFDPVRNDPRFERLLETRKTIQGGIE